MSNPYYETGACSSLSDFMDKMMTFAASASIDVGHRFTVETVTTPQTLNTAGAPSGGTTYSFTVKCLSRGGYYWWWRYNTTGGLYTMVAPNGGASSWNSVTGKPTNDCEVFPLPGGGVYHFVSIDDVINAVCVLSNGVHVHLNFGKLTKVGNWVGGEFTTGSRHNSSGGWNGTPISGYHRFMFQVGNTGRGTQGDGIMHCEYNSKNFAAMDYYYVNARSGYNLVKHVGGLPSGIGDWTGSARVCIDPDFSPNSFTPYRSSGFDLSYQLLRDADDSLFYDLGFVPGVRFVNMQLINPGDPLNTDWLVFPLSLKGLVGSSGNYASSADYGVAYYKG